MHFGEVGYKRTGRCASAQTYGSTTFIRLTPALSLRYHSADHGEKRFVPQTQSITARNPVADRRKGGNIWRSPCLTAGPRFTVLLSPLSRCSLAPLTAWYVSSGSPMAQAGT